MFFEATYDTRATLCLFGMEIIGKISEQMLKSILGPLFIKCESPRGPLSREKNILLYFFELFRYFSSENMGWSFDKYSVAAIVSTRDHQIPPKYGPGPDEMDGPVFVVRK